MAKAKNKIVMNRLKKQDVRQTEIFKNLKSRMQELMNVEDYVAAMDVMAEMAVNKKIDREVMYWGAMCYFRTGDYKRAAKWIDDALSCAGVGTKERILLAGICIADGRYEDGMRVIETVLADENESVTETDMEFMREIVKPVGYGYDDFLSKYPRVMALVQEGKKDVKDKASSALAKLKAILNKNKSDSKVETVERQTEYVEDGFDTAGTMQQIMASTVSLRAKIKMFNAFAAGCYQSGDYQAAFDLLNAALQLDAYAPELLKNMAYVCLAAGEKAQALEYAAKLPMADFGLLYALKNG